jgi:hypothetical protein
VLERHARRNPQLSAQGHGLHICGQHDGAVAWHAGIAAGDLAELVQALLPNAQEARERLVPHAHDQQGLVRDGDVADGLGDVSTDTACAGRHIHADRPVDRDRDLRQHQQQQKQPRPLQQHREGGHRTRARTVQAERRKTHPQNTHTQINPYGSSMFVPVFGGTYT